MWIPQPGTVRVGDGDGTGVEGDGAGDGACEGCPSPPPPPEPPPEDAPEPPVMPAAPVPEPPETAAGPELKRSARTGLTLAGGGGEDGVTPGLAGRVAGDWPLVLLADGAGRAVAPGT
jgi:hypothetical protein